MRKSVRSVDLGSSMRGYEVFIFVLIGYSTKVKRENEKGVMEFYDKVRIFLDNED